MKKKIRTMPVLLFNTEEKDRTACHIVMSSGIKCRFLASDDEDTPKLIHGYREFTGVEEIRSFVNCHRMEKE
jgi:hypothetical protein